LNIQKAGICIRPGAIECLKELSKSFELISFTASDGEYANAILNFLDPNNEIFKCRLSREHCVITDEGFFVKDLRIFANRNIKDIVLIDNSATSFLFQLENGIPVLPYFGGCEDSELLDLTNYLKSLDGLDDVREANKKMFKIKEMYQCSNLDDLFQVFFLKHISSLMEKVVL